MLNIVDPNTPPSPTAADIRKTDLLGLPREALRETLSPVIDRPFRAGQIYDALYRRAVSGFDQITELPRDLRERLDERFRIGWPEIETRALSSDGTCKYLFRVEGAASIEAVDIPDRDRRTFCVSSQAGCGLACAFCVTGFWGAGRNLTAGEILAQVLAIRADRGLPPEGLNLVFMGMGEPLLNIDNVKTAIDILTEWISPRRITLSTAGVIPGIEALAGWERRPNLAISLHAPDDERRSRIMPINRTYPLADLLAALRRFPLEKGRKITFEYILIRDFNDSEKDADQLAKTLRGLRAKVNLIPMNPDPVLGEAMVPPSDDQIDRFQKRLMQRDLIATVRRRRGDDVSAACGQLRAFGRDPRGFPKKLAEQRVISSSK